LFLIGQFLKIFSSEITFPIEAIEETNKKKEKKRKKKKFRFNWLSSFREEDF
jgi:hypothetical protein